MENIFNLESMLRYNEQINIVNNETLITAHIADLHFPVIDPVEKQYNILEEQFLSKIENMPRLDLICVNGDLFDHKIMTNSDATLYASMFVSRLVEIAKYKDATLILLHGTMSHDSNQLKIYYHYMNRSDVDVRIITSLRIENVKGCRILCIPELYGVDESIYQHYLFGSGFYDFAIMHGTFHGAVYGDNAGNGRLFRIEDFLNCKGPIISGHVHKPGCFDQHFYYCGSPYRWSFADDHDKGFILMSYNSYSRKYYLDYEPIISDTYKTIDIDSLINNNPLDTIKYINDLKLREGINYIRIKFNNPISNSDKMALSTEYRNNKNVTLEFFSQERELQRKAEEKIKQDTERVAFLLDNKYTDEQKFVMWVNYLKQDEAYLTVEELTQILSSDNI